MPRKKWRFSAGARGHRVTVYEGKPGGVLQARVWDSSRGRYLRRSLGHRNRDRAEAFALAEAQRLKEGRAELTASKVTAGRLFARYLAYQTPAKSLTEQQSDERRAELWSRVLGANQDAQIIPRRVWEAFIDARTSGAIDARGCRVPGDKRRPVSARAVQADCNWLKWVYNWAVSWWEDGRYLLTENPIRGFQVPEVKNIRRPVSSADRYEKVQNVSDQVMMSVYSNGKRQHVRSYLSEILDLAQHTGRRLSSILNLRYNDYLPDYTNEQGKRLPYGAARWRGKYDKRGKEWITPLNQAAQAAILRILRQRPGLGEAPLFPSRDDPMKPISRHVADSWLRKAERLAQLEPQDGSLWQAYRRGWATARKHLPPTDVAYAGGWASPTTLEKCYQHADLNTMLVVVSSGAEVREEEA